MSVELISKKTRNEFREFMVSWYLSQIEREFDAADIERRIDYLPPMSGQRRSLVEQYYASLDFANWNDVRRLLKVYENVLEVASQSTPSAFSSLCKWLRKDGLDYQEGRIVSLAGTPSLPQVKHLAVEFNAEYMANQIRRMEQSIESDPPLAIGSAKELLETCCKTILKDRNESTSERLDLPQLVKATLRELRLLPDDIPDTAKGAETIRRVLSNLAMVTQGLAELRNLYGSGHGKEGRSRGLRPRHAKLAVGAASALTVFLFETHKEMHARSWNETKRQ